MCSEGDESSSHDFSITQLLQNIVDFMQFESICWYNLRMRTNKQLMAHSIISIPLCFHPHVCIAIQHLIVTYICFIATSLNVLVCGCQCAILAGIMGSNNTAIDILYTWTSKAEIIHSKATVQCRRLLKTNNYAIAGHAESIMLYNPCYAYSVYKYIVGKCMYRCVWPCMLNNIQSCICTCV